MTLDAAKALAQKSATLHEKAYVAWRMPKWRADIYGVRAQCELPPEAEVHVFKPQERSLFDE